MDSLLIRFVDNFGALSTLGKFCDRIGTPDPDRKRCVDSSHLDQIAPFKVTPP